MVRTQSVIAPTKSITMNAGVALHFREIHPSSQQYQSLIARIQAASVEVQLEARPVASSLDGPLLLLPASRGQTLQVKGVEVDRIKVKRRIGATADGVGDDLPCEGEQHARALNHD